MEDDDAPNGNLEFLRDNDVEEGNSADSTDLDNDDTGVNSDEEVMEARNMRLSFKLDKDAGPSSHVRDVDNYHVFNEVDDIEETVRDSDDESIPEFMDEDDGDYQGFRSGNSTES